jgi:1-phosphofructokinase
VREAVTLGAAAGALNVTRHGLGTGDPAAIRRMSKFVRVTPIEAGLPTDIRMTPDQLAEFLTRE